MRTHTAAPTLYVNTRPSSPSRSALSFCPAKRPAEETLPSHPSWGFLSRQPCHQVRDMKGGGETTVVGRRRGKRSGRPPQSERGGEGRTDGPRREGPKTDAHGRILMSSHPLSLPSLSLFPPSRPLLRRRHSRVVMIIGGERRRGAWGLSSHSGSSAVRPFARWAGDCPALPNIIQRADDGEWTLRGDGMGGGGGGKRRGAL